MENPLDDRYVVREVLGALDRFVDVGKNAVAPTSDLVAEELEPACGTRSDGSLSDDASVGGQVLPHRPLLDHVLTARAVDDKCGVVEIACITMGEPSRDRFKHLPVQTH
jgi:hypothetical protein